MAFIIKKTSSRRGKTRTLHYLVANYRDNNEIKRETLLRLGESNNLGEFLEFTEREETELLNRLNKNKEKLENFIRYGTASIFLPRSPYMVRKNLIWWIKNAEKELEECRNKKKEIKSFM
jgi:hypothetical protein